jgi:hypothetical protein
VIAAQADTIRMTKVVFGFFATGETDGGSKPDEVRGHSGTTAD